MAFPDLMAAKAQGTYGESRSGQQVHVPPELRGKPIAYRAAEGLRWKNAVVVGNDRGDAVSEPIEYKACEYA
jgi:hypothetical protein